MTATPARFTHATMFWVEDALPVTTWTLTSSRVPVIPTGAPMPSCSSTTKSWGSTCRISRPLGSATAFAASIARRTSSRVISRFFPATATTPRLLNALTCGARQAEVDRVDLDAGRQLGFVDRLLDRFDRGLEVDDDAAPDAARVGEADPDDVEPAVVGHLADDGRDLRCADVQAHQVSFLTCHDAPPVSRRPVGLHCAFFDTRSLPPSSAPILLLARRRVRPDVEALAESADRRIRCPGPARAASVPGPRTTAARSRKRSSPMCSSAGSPSSITIASCRSLTSICDNRRERDLRGARRR